MVTQITCLPLFHSQPSFVTFMLSSDTLIVVIQQQILLQMSVYSTVSQTTATITHNSQHNLTVQNFCTNTSHLQFKQNATYK